MTKKISQKKFIKNLYDQGIDNLEAIKIVKEALDDGTLFKKEDNKKSNEKAARVMIRHYYYLFRRADKAIDEVEKMEEEALIAEGGEKEVIKEIEKQMPPLIDKKCIEKALQDKIDLPQGSPVVSEDIGHSISLSVKEEEKPLAKKSNWDL